MSDVRTFRAASMREALDLVRQDLGADAVILHTKQITGRRSLLPWRRRRPEVQITASCDVNVRTPEAAPLPAAAGHAGAVAPYHSTTATPGSYASPGEEDDGVIADFSRMPPVVGGRAAGTAGVSPRGEATFGEVIRRRAFDWPLPEPGQPQAEAPPAAPPAPPRVTESSHTTQLARKLARIESMLAEMGRADAPARGEIPPELFQVYTDLIDAEMEQDLARTLIGELAGMGHREALQKPAEVHAMLAAVLERRLQCSGPIQVTPGHRKIIALAGATGVGKTTTIAKLAANFRLRDEVRVGLVTVDTYRIAAVEQLRTYAEIIDLPMRVVTGPGEMQQALDELSGLDLVLIDTAGRSPRDDLQIEELRHLLDAAAVDEVHLVLSLTAGVQSLRSSIEKFAPVRPSRLILTKLDEATGMGPLLSVASLPELPVSYLTTGQGVPDDIEPAGETRLARLILGDDSRPGR